jgi:ketosteroid isomerase-like protein
MNAMIARLAAALLLLSATAARADEPRIPTEVVDAFHKALTDGDAAGALSLLGQDLVVFEFGLVDPTMQAYAFAHLPADMNMASQTTWTVQSRRMGGTGDQRWVLSSYKVTGKGADGQPFEQMTMETMILQKVGDAYRIVHIHWSTAPVPPPAPAK